MEKAVGYISYSVDVECPYCKKDLDLPADIVDDEEQELGACVFGFTDKPANWYRPNIKIECCYCKETFIIRRLEI